jgi:hypothetical protein
MRERAMKASRVILVVLGLAVVVVAAVVFLVISNLDAIVKAAMEKYGSEATGSAVTVASVRISLREGSGSISGLRIGNPPGFTTPAALDLEDITIEVDTGSVTGDPVVIRKVRVAGPRVMYEIDKSGRANLQEIMRNLERLTKPGAPAEPAEKKEAGEGKNLLIRDIIVEGGKVDARVAAFPGKDFSADLPRLHLTNVGGEGGATPSELARQILRPIMSRAAQAAAQSGGAAQYLGKSAEDAKRMLEGKAKEKLGTAGEEAAKEAEGTLKKLLGK